jgi:hypothetical protein
LQAFSHAIRSAFVTFSGSAILIPPSRATSSRGEAGAMAGW